jgi:predicted house-cleaning noncanonical NTP pyrophosphatase (MazG superfamily)
LLDRSKACSRQDSRDHPQFRTDTARTSRRDDEYRHLLREKLGEEVDEFLESEDPHELADVLEVVHALAGLLGLGFDGVEMIRVTKASERGAFAERVVWSGNSPTGARLDLDEQRQFDGRAVG